VAKGITYDHANMPWHRDHNHNHNSVFRDSAEWNCFINCTSKYILEQDFLETEIDFSVYQAIMAIRGCGDCLPFEILDITEHQDNIIVRYLFSLRPSMTGGVIYPFHIVRIPISSKEVIFVREVIQ